MLLLLANFCSVNVTYPNYLLMLYPISLVAKNFLLIIEWFNFFDCRITFSMRTVISLMCYISYIYLLKRFTKFFVYLGIICIVVFSLFLAYIALRMYEIQLSNRYYIIFATFVFITTTMTIIIELKNVGVNYVSDTIKESCK